VEEKEGEGGRRKRERWKDHEREGGRVKREELRGRNCNSRLDKDPTGNIHSVTSENIYTSIIHHNNVKHVPLTLIIKLLVSIARLETPPT